MIPEIEPVSQMRALSSEQAVANAAASANGPWQHVLAARRTGTIDASVGEPWQALFGPLVAYPERRLVIGQMGQSLDGRIATPSGHSHYVNGPAAIAHLHRLRALVDAVVVGVGTAIADDPALTVRHVEGASPARVVVDPGARMPETARLLADDGCRRILIARTGVMLPPRTLPSGVECIALDAGADGRIPPLAIVDALAARGLSRLLIEGGAATVSAFVAAGCLHRLHVAVAPLLIGSGPVGLTLPPIERLDEALRPRMRCYRLDEDMLWDVELSTARGVANRSR
jgi:diaminohydroxyphosphoribosylaminopyrimidine deaminase / 5-amino-6-(5-phosphoribosylamino)uracil reductase